jgi:hypothetical protein
MSRHLAREHFLDALDEGAKLELAEEVEDPGAIDVAVSAVAEVE